MKTKNIRIIMAALALITAASCQKDGVRTLTATFERFESDSKAFVDNDFYACWEADDMVSVNGTSCAVTLASGSAQSRSAQIVVPEGLDDQALLAFYPADRISNMSVAGGTVDFPHIQTYVERDGHQVIDNPMAAYCPADGEELHFRNLGSLLKVTIPNNEDIKAIQVKGVDNQMLCGKAQLKLNSNGEPRLTPCTGGFSSVTLRFPEAVRANGKSFYIVLPPNTNFETLTIAVLSNNGTAWATHAKTAYMGRMLAVNYIAAISYDLSHHEDYDFVADWTIRYTATERVDPNTTDWGTFGAAKAAYNFGGSKGLVVFDDIITKIGAEACKNNSSLQGITLPVSVTEIGNDAFDNCVGLTSVSMPNVTTIGEYAFRKCALTSVSLPLATTIESNTFRQCSKLTTVEMPNVTTIGKLAFYESGLTSISLPLATTIGEYAFAGCANLATAEIPCVTTIGIYAFKNCGLTAISLPLVTTIESCTFRECPNLATVSLPLATTIMDYAFYESGLATISMPNVTTIEYNAFWGCTSLATIYSKTAAPTIGSYAFYDVPHTAVLHLPSSLSGTTWSGWTGQYAYDYND